MDNLYENLENYEDSNIIHDLKNENKELKTKIEHYSTAMIKLQKNILQDFDKLSSEYKNLEINYSSLLKTAKAEIERKTQMITNLNIEKDMLVIKTLQTKGPRFLTKITQNIHSNKNNACSSNESIEHKERRSSPGKNIIKREHVDSNNINDVKLAEKNETKENEPDIETNNQARKIINRRKSMPASGLLENEHNKVMLKTEDENIKCNLLKNQRGNDNECFDRRSNRTSDTSSAENKYSYGSTFRESRYRNYYDRRRQTDENYRHNNRHEQQWQGGYLSSERNSRSRETDKHFHFDQRANRAPYDRYRRNRSRDRRSHYSNDYQREYEAPCRNFEKQPVKHKGQPLLDEPSQKKLRIDSYGEYLNANHEISERDYYENASSLISPDDPYRCQSPDHTLAGYNDQHLVKEIMHTAATPLEDPRISSKKYVLKTDNNKSVLTTASSQYMDVKPIDKSLWKIPIIPIPDALLHKPTTSKDNDLVSEVYKNIDNIELNVSIESGEVTNIEDEALIYGTLNTCEVNKTIENKDVKSSCKKPIQEKINSCTEKLAVNYKIPKINKTMKNPDTLKNVQRNTIDEICNKKGEERNMDLPDISSQSVHVTAVENVRLQGTPSLNHDTKDNRPKDSIHDTHVTLGTVESDLLLSDDASDNMDLLKQKQVEESSLKKPRNKFINESKANTDTPDDCSKKSDDDANCSRKEKDDSTNSRKESSGNKTKKTKKKLEPKAKEKNTDQVNLNTNKGVDKVKSKFSDLFGESSSLIMPEDLGLNVPTATTTIKNDKFESIFDDTQSAVDLPLKQKEVIGNKVEENIKTVFKEDDASPSHESNEKKISNDNSPNIKEHLIDDDDDMNLYKNLNAEVSMDGPNVVIISTGVQPNQIDNNSEIICDKVSNFKNVSSKCFLPALKALATSTPLKINAEPTEVTSHQVAENATQSSNNIDKSTNSIPIEQFNEPDVPDVRIFVKRRRKMKKP